MTDETSILSTRYELRRERVIGTGALCRRQKKRRGKREKEEEAVRGGCNHPGLIRGGHMLQGPLECFPERIVFLKATLPTALHAANELGLLIEAECHRNIVFKNETSSFGYFSLCSYSADRTDHVRRSV